MTTRPVEEVAVKADHGPQDRPRRWSGLDRVSHVAMTKWSDMDTGGGLVRQVGRPGQLPAIASPQKQLPAIGPPGLPYPRALATGCLSPLPASEPGWSL